MYYVYRYKEPENERLNKLLEPKKLEQLVDINRENQWFNSTDRRYSIEFKNGKVARLIKHKTHEENGYDWDQGYVSYVDENHITRERKEPINTDILEEALEQIYESEDFTENEKYQNRIIETLKNFKRGD